MIDRENAEKMEEKDEPTFAPGLETLHITIHYLRVAKEISSMSSEMFKLLEKAAELEKQLPKLKGHKSSIILAGVMDMSRKAMDLESKASAFGLLLQYSNLLSKYDNVKDLMDEVNRIEGEEAGK